jgi:COP9 signalosome complex subunit 3
VALLANITAFQSQNANALDREILWQKTLLFLETFDPRQVRYVGTEFSQVIIAAADLARRANQVRIYRSLVAFLAAVGRGGSVPWSDLLLISRIASTSEILTANTVQPGIAVSPIANAILRLDEAASTLTSIHILLARLTLESRAYSHAVSVIDRHIIHLPGLTHQSKPKYLCSRGLPAPSYITPDTGLTEKLRYQDILEYFLLSGTIFIGLRQWKKALELLECAVTYPTKDNAVSKIMVDAYKKWTLVNLLLYGKACGLPSTTNGSAAKSYHIIAKPYDIVANLFSSASASRLRAEVDIGQGIWKEDGNLGLMLFVLASYQKFQIRNLANVYRTIPIAEVTQMTVSAETAESLPSDLATETLILQMIAEGDVMALISHSTDATAVLNFHPSGPVLHEVEVQRKLAESFARIKSMTEAIKSTDRRLTYDKDYIKQAHKQKKLERSGVGDGISGEDMIWHPAEDEDLMAGNF